MCYAAETSAIQFLFSSTLKLFTFLTTFFRTTKQKPPGLLTKRACTCIVLHVCSLLPPPLGPDILEGKLGPYTSHCHKNQPGTHQQRMVQPRRNQLRSLPGLQTQETHGADQVCNARLHQDSGAGVTEGVCAVGRGCLSLLPGAAWGFQLGRRPHTLTFPVSAKPHLVLVYMYMYINVGC